MRFFLWARIHKAAVTEVNRDYVGSITIDETLMKKAELKEYEKGLVVDLQMAVGLRRMSSKVRNIQESFVPTSPQHILSSR